MSKINSLNRKIKSGWDLMSHPFVILAMYLYSIIIPCKKIRTLIVQGSYYFCLVRTTGLPPVAALADKQSAGLFGPSDKLLSHSSPYFKSLRPLNKKSTTARAVLVSL